MDPRFRGVFFDEDFKPYVEVLFNKVEKGKLNWKKSNPSFAKNR